MPLLTRGFQTCLYGSHATVHYVQSPHSTMAPNRLAWPALRFLQTLLDRMLHFVYLIAVRRHDFRSYRTAGLRVDRSDTKYQLRFLPPLESGTPARQLSQQTILRFFPRLLCVSEGPPHSCPACARKEKANAQKKQTRSARACLLPQM